MKLLHSFLFYFFLPCVVFPQGKLLHFNTANGLPHDITYGIFQDRDGFIWIGTDDGLAKYDGQEFKVFTTDDGLRNNFIIDINQVPNGDIVLATWGGGLQIIRNDKVLPLKIKGDGTEKLNHLQIWGDDIIARHSYGNIIYEKTNKTYQKKLVVLKNNKVQKVNFTLGTGRQYLTIIDNKPFFINGIKSLYNIYTTTDKGIYEVKNDNINSLTGYFKESVVNSISKIDQNNFLVTIKDSLFYVNRHTIVRKFKLDFDDASNIICDIAKINSNQYLVMATDLKGFKNAYLFSNDFKTKVGIKKLLNVKATISDFMIDNENNIWITTNGEGIFCYNPNLSSFMNISKNKLPETLILGIEELKEKKYILSPNYLSSFSDSTTIKSIKINGIGKKLTVLNKDQIIVNSINIKNGSQHTPNIKEVTGFNTICLEQNSTIYVDDSIYIEKYQVKFPRNKRNINDAVLYKDTLWFATNLGMFYYDKNKRDIVKKSIGNKKLLSENIKKLLLDRGGLWIATYKGLCKISNDTLYTYSQKNGLICDQINTLITDHNHNLWIGTNKGISVFDQKNFINLTTSRGLLSPFINVIFESSTNEILVGSDKGVTIIDNNKPLKLELPPLLHISQNQSIFNYTIISYNRSNSLIAQYNLDEKGWVTLEKPKGSLSLQNQKKGNHSLVFRAKKQDGSWGYSKVYNFKTSIPWFKDIIYISLLVMVISLSIIMMILYQLRKVKKRNNDLKFAIERQHQLENELSEVRMNIAQDFHDDLGNKLARISLLSNLAKEEVSHENVKLKSRIEQIENDAGYLYKGTKDFIFSLNDESNYLEELVTYLSDFGEEFYQDTHIKFIVEKRIKNNIKLPYYWSKQLIYIFKEALTNAFKHSKGDKVVFSFDYDGITLTIKCSDNGIGVKKTESIASNGITNMTKRAKKLGGVLEIQFERDAGTTVVFVAKTTSKGSA
ncbi:histidine kinase [Flavobacterium sp. AS60]|uniref:ligand-binding sensor domain-containing protein n=1 Tax=Flavobacterium anseongense TaxID=2910677 RepID=UPI001F18CCBF|nr:two-component regulator propeller domain-containing protein [Flavobacterium sp. AS60]MCF6130111.1 histidine kinase [Flavobacterium sp. AS60]